MVRSIQEMNEDTVLLEDLIKDIYSSAVGAMLEVHRLRALQEHGVKLVDKNTHEPVIPNNVVILPTSEVLN